MGRDKKVSRLNSACISRRSFLYHSGVMMAGMTVLPSVAGMEGKVLTARTAHYPRLLIARMSELQEKTPVLFNYPDLEANTSSMLVKLGAQAGGGIGPDRDVVAFNTLCPHMGGLMTGTYQPDEQVMGPCPFHQSLYDLTRYGMIISGHGTESLPQVLLELEGDDIYAMGLIGLIYGRYDNLKA